MLCREQMDFEYSVGSPLLILPLAMVYSGLTNEMIGNKILKCLILFNICFVVVSIVWPLATGMNNH